MRITTSPDVVVVGGGVVGAAGLVLPAASEPPVDRAVALDTGAEPRPAARAAGERVRVLAIDDEIQMLRLLRRHLDEAGYRPILSMDPSQAMELVESEQPDLVLLDLLQRLWEFSGVPVVFLTVSDRKEHVVKALDLGADDYGTLVDRRLLFRSVPGHRPTRGKPGAAICKA